MTARKRGTYIRIRRGAPGHIKVRKSSRPKVWSPEQLVAQEKIKEAAKLIGEECTGQKGEKFVQCRAQVAEKVWPKKPEEPSVPQ